MGHDRPQLALILIQYFRRPLTARTTNLQKSFGSEPVDRGRDDAMACMCRPAIQQIGRWSCAVALAAWFPAPALAQLHAMPYADIAYQYDSNVFALPSSAPEPVGTHGPTFSDQYLEERAGVDALYDWSRSAERRVGKEDR